VATRDASFMPFPFGIPLGTLAASILSKVSTYPELAAGAYGFLSWFSCYCYLKGYYCTTVKLHSPSLHYYKILFVKVPERIS